MSTKSARAKYFDDLLRYKKRNWAKKYPWIRKVKEREEKTSKKSQLEEVNSRIKQTEIYLKSAEESILKGNKINFK